ncbi:Hsp20/alpha crystallin family protein [Janthinobacterium rivuli]|uniref:Hsp20/alpha crystallin family protein n=1 Tax=Janthinobacterium sp. FT68W TaxID=2654255 RepID=UPI00186B10B7|nr:Hsp20/alpha crystallin family protein [Janthinobacterium sp. FT68W]
MAAILQRSTPLAGRFPSVARLEERFRLWRLRHALHALRGRRRFRLDVTENDDAYLVQAELPGCDKDALRVEVDGNAVLIFAETPRQEQGGKDGRQSEAQYRYFTLEHALDDSAAAARYHHGVLELRLPKKKSGRGRYVPVS